MDSTTDEKIDFSDIFIPGYDPNPLIRSKLKESIQIYFANNEGNLALTAEEKAQYLSDDYINGLIDLQKGFLLTTTTVSVFVPEITIDNITFPLTVDIFYKEIGIENLTLFEE
jgi:hypothetical protein